MDVKKNTDTHQSEGRLPRSKYRFFNSRFMNFRLFLVIIVVLISAFVVVGTLVFIRNNKPMIDNGRYQAVFLSNGQVYFGKLSDANTEYYRLTDVFYLQTQNTSSDKVQNATDSSSSNVELIKLGNEIHGPDDEMVIRKEQVLFFENIKTDGTVTKSIEKYKNQDQ